MKIASLHLKAFGPFTDQVVDFGGPDKSLAMIYGPNEAGKSAMLRAIEALRFQIDARSPDDFRHDYATMCVGGTFLNPDGGELSVVRLKRLKDPLRLGRPLGNGKLEVIDTPAPSGVQEHLTGRLSREEYQRMFGLDHNSLRAGGQRLAQGDVEVGTSLFEASLGVRDIAAIVEELDARSRGLFTPGARGSKGRINEALKRYKELQQQIKSSTTRPRDWQERFSASERATESVRRFEDQQRQLNERQNLLATVRGAAPVIRDLDDAMAALVELAEVPDLPEDASTRRTASVTSLQAAQQALEAANELEQTARTRLADLQPDPAVLELAGGIARLVAKSEEVDLLRRTLAQLGIQYDRQAEELRRMSGEIDSSADRETLLALVPTPARQAEIEQRVQVVLSAEQALENLEQATSAEQSTSDAPDAKQPTDAAIGQFQRRLAELEGERNALARLYALPDEIDGAKAVLHQLLSDLALSDEAALLQVRPILDAEIDEAAHDLQEAQNSQQGLTDRIAQIEPELRAAKALRDHMRNDKAVVTYDEVLLARERRELGWQAVRTTFIDGGDSPADANLSGFVADGSLPVVYERQVREADERADGHARDTRAAAELKAKDAEIARYERDQQALTEQLAEVEEKTHALAGRWRAKLAAQGLQERGPLALREWQGLLNEARQARASLARLRSEYEKAQELESKLSEGLRAAIEAIQPGSTSSDDPLSSLEITARHLEARIQQRQQVIDANRARLGLLSDQAKKRATRQAQLEKRLEDARARLAEVVAEMHLPADSSGAAVRARVSELVRLDEANAAVLELVEKQEQARAGLAQIAGDARLAATKLNIELSEGAQHLRPLFDVLEERLEHAREVHSQQEVAERDLKNAQESARTQSAAVKKHELALRAFCELAGVTEVELLADVERRAERKRLALTSRDRCLQQLQTSSDLALSELRGHLATLDAGHLQAQQDQCASELEALTPILDGARAQAELRRRELESIDDSDQAAQAQDALCQTSAVIERDLRPWIQLRLAHRLLLEAQRRFQERAQGPMLERASDHFRRMTDHAFSRLSTGTNASERQVLLAQRADGSAIGTDAMSEGTRDQLYLALRLAAVSLRRDAGVDLPMVLDDVLMTSSDGRAGCVLQALGEFSRGSQVIVFTHHEHLLEVARRHVPAELLHVTTL